MSRNQKPVSASGVMLWVIVVFNAILLKQAFVSNPDYYWALSVSVPLLLLAIYNMRSSINKTYSSL